MIKMFNTQCRSGYSSRSWLVSAGPSYSLYPVVTLAHAQNTFHTLDSYQVPALTPSGLSRLAGVLLTEATRQCWNGQAGLSHYYVERRNAQQPIHSRQIIAKPPTHNLLSVQPRTSTSRPEPSPPRHTRTILNGSSDLDQPRTSLSATPLSLCSPSFEPPAQQGPPPPPAVLANEEIANFALGLIAHSLTFLLDYNLDLSKSLRQRL